MHHLLLNSKLVIKNAFNSSLVFRCLSLSFSFSLYFQLDLSNIYLCIFYMYASICPPLHLRVNSYLTLFYGQPTLCLFSSPVLITLLLLYYSSVCLQSCPWQPLGLPLIYRRISFTRTHPYVSLRLSILLSWSCLPTSNPSSVLSSPPPSLVLLQSGKVLMRGNSIERRKLRESQDEMLREQRVSTEYEER